MNREIKFRIWDVDASEMIKNPNEPYSEVYLEFQEGSLVYMMADPEWDRSPEKREGVIMQYTGCKDSKGQEIYDGDILRTINHYEGKKPYYTHHKVLWDQEVTGFKCVNLQCEGESLLENGNCQLWVYMKNIECEVVGNIYEHEKLIEKCRKEK